MVQRRWNPAQLCYFALPFLHQSPQDHRRAKWGEMPPSVPVASHHLLFCQTPSVIARILRWLPSVHVNTVLLATVNVECRPMKVQLAVRIVTPAPVDVSELRKGRGDTREIHGCAKARQSRPAALRSISALSVLSHGASISVRPKWPYAAVAL